MVDYEKLCRVKRVPNGTPFEAGTLLALDGCWQNKAVVTHVVMVNDKAKPIWGSQQYPEYGEFVVGIKTLGRFYADGRAKPSKYQPEREVSIVIPMVQGVPVWDTHKLFGAWCPVQYADKPLKQPLIVKDKPKFKAVEKAIPSVNPKSPEAILADYAL